LVVIAIGATRRRVWWLCQRSIWRALACGLGVAYLAIFLGVDPASAFVATQVTRVLVRWLGRRRAGYRWARRRVAEEESPLGEPLGAHEIVEPGLADASTPSEVASAAFEPEAGEAVAIEGPTSLDPGPEEGDPGPGVEEPRAGGRMADELAFAPWVDGHVLAFAPTDPHTIGAGRTREEAWARATIPKI
jgi:hypothetical protein